MADTTDTQAGNPAAEPQTTTAAPGTFTQEQINTFIANEKRQWQSAQKAAADKIKADAEAAAAAEKGEFKTLAEQRAARIAELEATDGSRQERLTALEAEIKAQSDARLKALPKEIAEMKPETDDPLIVYRWLARAEQAAVKLTGAAQPIVNRGTPPGPRNSGALAVASNGPSNDVLAEKRARMGSL